MSNGHALRHISQRLSLRKPLAESVDRLDAMLLAANGKTGHEALEAMQRALRSIEPNDQLLEDFERDFPNLCFAIATGVGKTRLMGAMIAYLAECHGVRDFVMLAPNLTIYNKLVADFTPGTKQYVFQGLGQFATTPPLVITGETWNSLASVRVQSTLERDRVHINIFNISKINVKEGRRIRDFQEVIGQSYFQYLAGRQKLVVLMDEAHRYRASASTQAIMDLKPWLGIEMTATAQTEGAKGARFRNIVMDYGLGQAMKDGYVKEPFVATRKNFNPAEHTAEELERVKLEDAILLHEEKKIELETYATQEGLPVVKPFVLVVAQDTKHAEQLQTYMESPDFRNGHYKGKVIQIHSALKGEEKDEVIEQLLAVEDPANPIEVVIHVNMLREGWDVKNLYTIVPLRKADSKTLVEQSIGRGVRLPYGRRVGSDAVDALNIVFHDKFSEVVQSARQGKMIALKERILDETGAPAPKEPVKVTTLVDDVLEGRDAEAAARLPEPARRRLKDEAFKATARAVLDVQRVHRTLSPGTKAFREQVRERLPEDLRGALNDAELDQDIKTTAQIAETLSIRVPRVLIQPVGERRILFNQFHLDVSTIRFQPVEWEIVRESLEKEGRTTSQYARTAAETREPRDVVVARLMDYDDIDYDANSSVLYRLANQLVDHLRSYLANEDDVRNVLLHDLGFLAEHIHGQLLKHRIETDLHYESSVSRGEPVLLADHFLVQDARNAWPFRTEPPVKSQIRNMYFTGFKKSIRKSTKFDSDSERIFSVILEDDKAVLKWVRPRRGDISIFWEHGERYEPDFIVETAKAMFLCEAKARNEMETVEVKAKARAAVEWCRAANGIAEKPWSYLLIPHDDIQPNMQLARFVERYAPK